jgi:DNA polymerase-3 subunit gamma/tau
VIRELARLTRDLLVLSIDPSRVSDPEIAADAERQPMLDLSRRFSGEDLMRAFDVLTKAEFDIKSAAQPRYHLEMALLRWIHLGKLTPLVDLIGQMQGGAAQTRPVHVPPPRPAVTPAPRAETVKAVEATRAAAPPAAPKAEAVGTGEEGGLKERLLAEIRRQKKFFHGTVVAQAQRIDLDQDKVVFVFGPQHRPLRAQLDQNRPWLEATASELAGRKIAVVSSEGPPSAIDAGSSARPASKDDSQATQPAAPGAPGAGTPDKKQALKDRALSDAGVQTMLDVFAAEIKDVEEM